MMTVAPDHVAWPDPPLPMSVRNPLGTVSCPEVISTTPVAPGYSPHNDIIAGDPRTVLHHDGALRTGAHTTITDWSDVSVELLAIIN